MARLTNIYTHPIEVPILIHGLRSDGWSVDNSVVSDIREIKLEGKPNGQRWWPSSTWLKTSSGPHHQHRVLQVSKLAGGA